MTLTVEDGTGIATADAYVSVADADAYHAAQGDPTSWSSASTADKEAAIRQATTYLDAKFARRWKGVRSVKTQALKWPRIGVIDLDGYCLDYNEMPVKLAYATAELALKIIDGTSLFSDVENAGAITTGEKIKVGSISVEESFAANGSASEQTLFTKAKSLILDYIESPTTVERA